MSTAIASIGIGVAGGIGLAAGFGASALIAHRGAERGASPRDQLDDGLKLGLAAGGIPLMAGAVAMLVSQVCRGPAQAGLTAAALGYTALGTSAAVGAWAGTALGAMHVASR